MGMIYTSFSCILSRRYIPCVCFLSVDTLCVAELRRLFMEPDVVGRPGVGASTTPARVCIEIIEAFFTRHLPTRSGVYNALKIQY